jgi:pimeloyl-ACP methyl ester carboxylesterase
MRRLGDAYASVHAVDIPGFGADDLPLPNGVDGLCDFLDAYLTHAGLQRPTIVAHSFAGFWVIHYADRHPDRVGRLVLMNPAGIFPTLGRWGYYYSRIFKAGFPQGPLRALGRYGRWVLRRAGELAGASPEWHYWCATLTNPRASGDTLLASYIHRAGNRFWWGEPALPVLLRLRVPLALCWSEQDTMMPAHQCEVLEKLLHRAGVPCPVRICPGAKHNPMGTEACHFLKGLANGESPTISGPDPAVARHCAAVLRTRFASTPGLRHTADIIETLYQRLIEKS